jgi:excisionase family DNA binding protein
MDNNDSNRVFEELVEKTIYEELLKLKNSLSKANNYTIKRYITIKEATYSTGISSSVLRQLTYSRAMPHLKLRGRLVFEEEKIIDTVAEYKNYGWTDPNNNWDVTKVQSEIMNFNTENGGAKMIEDILREIIRDELNKFSNDLRAEAKQDKTSYYGRTVFTVKEAAEYFRTSPATIYSLIKEDEMPHFKIQSRSFIVLEEAEAFLWRETAKSYASEGNIYWQRILQNLDWEEKERNSAYKRALKRMEESF